MIIAMEVCVLGVAFCWGVLITAWIGKRLEEEQERKANHYYRNMIHYYQQARHFQMRAHEAETALYARHQISRLYDQAREWIRRAV